MRDVGISIKIKGAGSVCALASAALAAAALVAFLIYGAVYTVYFDLVVALGFALGAAGNAAYALIDEAWSEFLGLVGVACTAFGTGLFILNAYPVMADWWGQFNMYGSQGGLTPVVIIASLALASLAMGTVACFIQKGGE